MLSLVDVKALVEEGLDYPKEILKVKERHKDCSENENVARLFNEEAIHVEETISDINKSLRRIKRLFDELEVSFMYLDEYEIMMNEEDEP